VNAAKRLRLRPVGIPGSDGAQDYQVIGVDVVEWSSGAVYCRGTNVLASDGAVYAAQATVHRGVDPVSDDGKNWHRISA